MKKLVVLKLDLEDDREVKRKALKAVSTLSGIDEIAMDVKSKTLKVVGTIDPIAVVCKLRKKNWSTNIILVGPASEAELKLKSMEKEERKDEDKKESSKKVKATKKKEESGEKMPAPAPAPALQAEMVAPHLTTPYRQYYQSLSTSFSVSHSMEENPNACVIS